MRVFLHAGVHKTATTTAQTFLHENRTLIWPHAALVLPSRIKTVTEAVFADGRDEAAITAAMAAFLAGLGLNPRRRIIISAENLLGRMPDGLGAPYPDAVPTLRGLLAAFDGLGWPCEVTVYLSTRDQAGWEESLWAHNVRKARTVPFTDDLATFRADVGHTPLAARLAQIRDALPAVRFLHHDTADFARMPFGPGQPFMDFLALPAAKQRAFAPVPPRNTTPPRAMTDRFLALNRSGLDEIALTEAKRAIRREHAVPESGEE